MSELEKQMALITDHEQARAIFKAVADLMRARELVGLPINMHSAFCKVMTLLDS